MVANKKVVGRIKRKKQHQRKRKERRNMYEKPPPIKRNQHKISPNKSSGQEPKTILELPTPIVYMPFRKLQFTSLRRPCRESFPPYYARVVEEKQRRNPFPVCLHEFLDSISSGVFIIFDNTLEKSKSTRIPSCRRVIDRPSSCRHYALAFLFRQ